MVETSLTSLIGNRLVVVLPYTGYDVNSSTMYEYILLALICQAIGDDAAALVQTANTLKPKVDYSTR